MFYIYLWIYTFSVMIIWWVYAIITIHSLKFKNFSQNISLFIKLLFWFFAIMTIIGYILIFYNSDILDKKAEVNVVKNHIIKETSY
jgi:hypothetical protein